MLYNSKLNALSPSYSSSSSGKPPIALISLTTFVEGVNSTFLPNPLLLDVSVFSSTATTFTVGTIEVDTTTFSSNSLSTKSLAPSNSSSLLKSSFFITISNLSTATLSSLSPHAFLYSGTVNSNFRYSPSLSSNTTGTLLTTPINSPSK